MLGQDDHYLLFFFYKAMMKILVYLFPMIFQFATLNHPRVAAHIHWTPRLRLCQSRPTQCLWKPGKPRCLCRVLWLLGNKRCSPQPGRCSTPNMARKVILIRDKNPAPEVFKPPAFNVQWTGSRENLQETIDFPTKYGGFRLTFPLNHFVEMWVGAKTSQVLMIEKPAIKFVNTGMVDPFNLPNIAGEWFI